MNVPLYNTQDIRQCEHIAIQGLPEAVLMMRAADAAFKHIKTHFAAAQRIVICCGSGNNGGDGYVLASLLKQAGDTVSILQLTTSVNTDVANDAMQQAKKHGVPCQLFTDINATDLAEVDLVVDAVLGIGVRDAIHSPAADMIQLINTLRRPVLALDIPSGLQPDTGHYQGAVVTATHTLTFIGGKVGLFTGKGPNYVGEVFVADLDLPQAALTGIIPTAIATDWQGVQSQLPSRPRHAHKGDMGHVLVIGGNYGMGGAAALAAQAAYRVGAGLVSVATRAQHVAPLLSHMPELMVHAIEDAADITPLLERADVIVLGPGLGHDTWATQLFKQSLTTQKPCVIDADGLNQLASAPTLITNAILTPHPGEAARLLTSSVETVQQDRMLALNTLVQRYHATVVLKGLGTCIGSPTMPSAYICPVGNPGMASGGMGDILSGIIAGLQAQGLSASQAACVGVCAHGYAGDLAAQAVERGLIASDLLPYLKRIMG